MRASGSSFFTRTVVACAVALSGLTAGTSACLLDWDGLRSGGKQTDGGSSDEDSGEPVTATDSGGATGCGAGALLINELGVAGSGGSSDEFVELFNGGSCEVKLEGFTLRYSSATGSTPFAVWTGAATDRILAGGYLVLGGDGFTGRADGKLRGDTAGTLAAAGGGVGLFPATGDVVDSVAYGSASTTHPFLRPSGGTPAGAPPTRQALARIPNAKDTDNSADDFRIAPPSPGATN